MLLVRPSISLWRHVTDTFPVPILSKVLLGCLPERDQGESSSERDSLSHVCTYIIM